MIDVLSSPTALLLVLGLSATVALQITGDVRQSIEGVKNKKRGKKPRALPAIRLESDLLVSGMRASRQALAYYKHKAVPSELPKPTTKHRLVLSWPLIVAALALVATVVTLEGIIAACMGVLIYLGIMSAIGLLAWPARAITTPGNKLGIALLAPYSVFFRYQN